jgi:polysaccharide export outer membrane protein
MMSLHHLITTTLLVAALSVPVPSHSQAQSAAASATVERGRSAIAADSAAFAQPGDIVRLRIWREPDMSGDFTVDAKGIATFPRLGSLQVTRIDADSLQRMLVAEYARYLKNPAVEVVLLRRVRVVGAVRTPGLYTADQTMRIRDVLALAGGASAEGRTDRVRIDRDGRAMMLDLNASPRVNEFALRSGDQLYVPERSWIARNTPLVAAILSVSGGLIIAFSAR